MTTRVKSNSTDEIFEFEDEDLDWEQTGSDPDRQMGPELFYEGTIEFEAKDGTTVTYTREESEYPIGSPREVNDITVEGGILL